MIKVIARKGVRVPLEDDARAYITDAVAVQVNERSAYYIRRLRDGDLLIASEKAVEPAAKPVTPVAEKAADNAAKKES
jgi:hypothetical protein